MRVLLVAGGWSPEREISLRGAKSLQKTMLERGHDVTLFDLNEGFDRLLTAAKKHDVAFINLHGSPGEDGLVQALLERVSCPYQGSSPAGSFVALNKAATKALLKNVGMKVAQDIFLPVLPKADWQCPLPFPVFVKSNTGGSSLHLGKAENADALQKHIQDIFETGSEVLIESLIVGREVTCGVLHVTEQAEALPPVLIVPKREFFDYHDKYSGAEGAEELCPAPLPAELVQRIQDAALLAHNTLKLHGYSRTDFIITENDELIVLEVNTLPGMTDVSLVPQEAAAAGISYGELVDSLLKSAITRHNQ